MFLRSSYPIEQSRTLHVLTGRENSKMAASKPDDPISQPVDMIGTRFQRPYLCFEVQLSNRIIKNIARPYRKRKFQCGGLQTGSIDISLSEHDRNTLPTIVSMFPESGKMERLVKMLSDVWLYCKNYVKNYITLKRGVPYRTYKLLNDLPKIFTPNWSRLIEMFE